MKVSLKHKFALGEDSILKKRLIKTLLNHHIQIKNNLNNSTNSIDFLAKYSNKKTDKVFIKNYQDA